MPIMTGTNPKRQRAITEAVWTTIYLAYKDPDDRSSVPISVPVEEAVAALLTCAAKLVSTLADARQRQKLIAAASPALDRAVSANLAQSAPAAGVSRELILPNGTDLILPN